MSEKQQRLPLIVHVIYRLDVGGLENGLVNLINHMPRRFRHAIVCLTVETRFRDRIEIDGVEVYQLHKREGKDFSAYLKLWKLLQRLHPSIVHTRNIATLDHQFTAFLARVPCRIHGEHGWDLFDLQGQSSKYRYLRRLSQSVVHGFIAVSKHMDLWLTQSVGINSAKVMQIYNGVDTDRFRPRKAHEQRQITTGFAEETDFVIGTVGRLEPVKNQLMLLKAFIAARNTGRSSRALKLVVVGDGSQYPDIQDLVREHELQEHVWMPGARDDIPDIMQCLDLFVLPSKNEGISNTILEAMASGLPIVATDVGGNGELVENGKTGKLVALDDVSGLADAIIAYANDADATHNQARAARDTVEKDYSISRMVNDYVRLYDRMLSSVNFTRGYRSCVE